VAQWCDWIEEPLDQQLVDEVKQILKPIHNWVYSEGLPINCDT
jgi:L-galactose dehydrogenase